MPGRLTPLVTDEIYHIFNRGIDHRITFTNKREYQRALQTMKFYQFISPPMKLSVFLTLSEDKRKKVISGFIGKNQRLIEFLAFCLMPNHFHFLLKQKTDGGISKFMSNFQNSFTRYFNTRQKRTGPLFLDQFKAVRIETDEQLLHVSRYIHLNPYSSFVIKSIKDLKNYQWSSFLEYLYLQKDDICKQEDILSFFPNKRGYEKFVFDQAEYQRELEKIKHLVLES